MKYLLSLFLIVSSLLTVAQEDSAKANVKLLFSIQHKAEAFTTDQLGNIFLWNNNNIWMYSKTGDSLASFNSRKYGDVSHVDATNPYEILVFFSDYNLTLFLDNYLSDNGQAIDLQELGYDQISHACKSRANGIWIYDLIQQRAIHLDNNYKADKQTLNLSQWFNERVRPNQLLEFNNQLFISSDSAVFVFDHFGTFKRKYSIKGVNKFQLINETIHYYRNGKFCMYTPKDFKETCKDLDNLLLLNMRIEKNRHYLLGSKKLDVFSAN